jgi:hypothetical protein
VELTLEVEVRRTKELAQASAASQGPPVKIKPSKKENQLEKDLKQLRKDLASVNALEVKALASVAKMAQVKQSIEKDIRESAAAQYKRGLVGHESVKSSMKRKKFYLGEIATTEGIKNSSVTKARGVLWAKPWAPGVNTAFLEGGVTAGAVYKLKTAVPDNIKKALADGDHAAFKDSVRNQNSMAYRPFWHGVENRFTTYTDELTYLLQNGYRLHEFSRKDRTTQQLLVHPSQLAAVTAAYDGR